MWRPEPPRQEHEAAPVGDLARFVEDNPVAACLGDIDRDGDRGIDGGRSIG